MPVCFEGHNVPNAKTKSWPLQSKSISLEQMANYTGFSRKLKQKNSRIEDFIHDVSCNIRAGNF
jgi:hypothetical protein